MSRIRCTPSFRERDLQRSSSAGARIRTWELLREQILSLPPLAARPPRREGEDGARPYSSSPSSGSPSGSVGSSTRIASGRPIGDRRGSVSEVAGPRARSGIRRTRPHRKQVRLRRPDRSRVRTVRPSTQYAPHPRQYSSAYSRSSRTLYRIPMRRARETYRSGSAEDAARDSCSASPKRSEILSWAMRIIAPVRRPRRPRRSGGAAPRDIPGIPRRWPISACCSWGNGRPYRPDPAGPRPEGEGSPGERPGPRRAAVGRGPEARRRGARGSGAVAGCRERSGEEGPGNPGGPAVPADAHVPSKYMRYLTNIDDVETALRGPRDPGFRALRGARVRAARPPDPVREPAARRPHPRPGRDRPHHAGGGRPDHASEDRRRSPRGRPDRHLG